MNRSCFISLAITAPLLYFGCGGSLVDADLKRSMTQYDLAVGLHHEGNTPGAFQALYRAIKLDPENAKAHLFLGTLYLFNRNNNQQEYDRNAEKYFRKVLQVQSSERKCPENLSADARNKLGVLYIHQRRYREATNELKIAVADLFNRQAYLAWGNLGWAYYEMKRLEQAQQALLRAIELQKQFCVGYFRLGQVYSAMKKYEMAEKALTQAIEVDDRCNTFQDAWYLRGQVRAHLGEGDDAVVDLERCVQLDPDSQTGNACSRLLSQTHEQ